MGERIKIMAGSVSQSAILNDSECAKKIYAALPIEARASTWGDEIYFGINVKCDKESPSSTVEMGDLGYWYEGSCFCIFFGPTPASVGDEIRPASPVEVFGKLEGDPKEFRQVESGEKVRIEKA
jgi:hypothetical protein